MFDYKEFSKAVELAKKTLGEPLTKEIEKMADSKNDIELKLLKDADIINRVEKREPLVICGVKYVPEGVNAMTDIKNQPHYTQFKIQPIVFITENNLPYIDGNIIKYVCRYSRKNGIEDLKKAQHYLEMLISKLEGKGVFGSGEVKQEEKPMTAKEVLEHERALDRAIAKAKARECADVVVSTFLPENQPDSMGVEVQQEDKEKLKEVSGVNILKKYRCSLCEGRHIYKDFPCPRCKGLGYGIAEDECKSCNGKGTAVTYYAVTGTYEKETCINCNGSGRITNNQTTKQEEKATLSNNYIIRTSKCMFCNGEGTRVVNDPLSSEKETCKVCKGAGIIVYKQKENKNG